jgi:adenine phosphoribosyltransferase
LIPVRKPRKLPWKTAAVEYALEYGTDRLEIHADACDDRARILIVDDVLATGGTAKASAELVRGTGAALVGFSFLMTLSFLKGAERLSGIRIEQVLTY